MTRNVLAGTSWLVVDGIEIPDGVAVTAELSEDVVSGSSGCNTYRASYEVDGDLLRLTGPIAGTRKMCPEPQMLVESEVLLRLEQVASFRVDGDELTLLDGEGELLLGLQAVGPNSLLGTWQVVSIHVPERQAIVGVDGDLHLSFEDGIVHGHAGCNTFSGPWASDGRTLRVGPLATTVMMGPEPIMRQEQELFGALGSVVGWRVATGHVDLLREDGGIAVSLAPREG